MAITIKEAAVIAAKAFEKKPVKPWPNYGLFLDKSDRGKIIKVGKWPSR